MTLALPRLVEPAEVSERGTSLHPTNPPTRHWRVLLQAAASLAFFGIAAIILTWPLCLRLSTTIPGCAAEQQQFIWDMSWAVRALQLRSDPWLTTYLFAPQGTNLAIHVALLGPSFLLSPVTYVWGPIVACNLWILSCIVLAGFLAERLLLALGTQRPIALWGGIALAFSPVMMQRVTGQSNLIAFWEVLLCCLLVLVWRRHACRAQDTYRYLLLWSCGLAFTILTDYQIAMFAVAGSLAVLVFPLPVQSQSPSHPRLSKLSPARLTAALSPVLAVAFLILYHLSLARRMGFTPSTSVAHAVLYHVFPQTLFVRPQLAAMPGSNGVGGPCPTIPFGDSSPLPGGYERYGYLGFMTAVGIIAGIIASGTRFFARARIWCLMAAGAAVLSLGGRFVWTPPTSGDIATAVWTWSHGLPLPYLGIMNLGLAPYFREPGRFAIAATIFGAIGSAVVLDGLVTAIVLKAPRIASAVRKQSVLYAIVTLLCAGSISDGWLRPFPLANLNFVVSDHTISALRRLPSGIVLPLPTERVTGDASNLVSPPFTADLVSAVTGKPTVGGYVARAPLAQVSFLQAYPILARLQSRHGTLRHSPADITRLAVLARAWHIRYVLIDENAYTRAEVQALTRLFGHVVTAMDSSSAPSVQCARNDRFCLLVLPRQR